MKRQSATGAAWVSITDELRAKYDAARRNVREWEPMRGGAYRRERRRLWGVALKAVERAK
jgi:hypothetical protein